MSKPNIVSKLFPFISYVSIFCLAFSVSYLYSKYFEQPKEISYENINIVDMLNSDYIAKDDINIKINLYSERECYEVENRYSTSTRCDSEWGWYECKITNSSKPSHLTCKEYRENTSGSYAATIFVITLILIFYLKDRYEKYNT